MGSTRRRFTDDYKREAVSFVIEGGQSIAEVARNIGVPEMTLGKWVKKAKDAGGGDERAFDVLERAELQRLREANAQLQLQVAFAKKVATWFASGQR